MPLLNAADLQALAQHIAECMGGLLEQRGLMHAVRTESGPETGLSQLCEEGATQLFKPLRNNDQILGAVGQLQFEVVQFRLQDEYAVECNFEPINVHTARWIVADDERKLEEFRTKAHDSLALDHAGALVFLAPTRVNLSLTQERWPGIKFLETREHLAA